MLFQNSPLQYTIKKLLNMTSFIRKIFFSDIEETPLGHSVLKNQWIRFLDLWNNKLEVKSNAIGIERILKLILVLLQFPFPGIYVRAFFGQFGTLWKNLGIEIYVFFKIISAFAILNFQLYKYCLLPNGKSIFYYWVIYMIAESLFYTATLVFCSDVFAKPRSYKRNIILLLCDYLEIVVDFASLYLMTNALQFVNNHDQIVKSLDAAYFSFVSSLTIGYGDMVVINDIGKKLVILQAIVFLIYGVLFLNFYTARIEEKK